MTALDAIERSRAGAHKKLDDGRLALALGSPNDFLLYVTRPNGLGYRRASDDDGIDPNAVGWAPTHPLTEEEIMARKSRAAAPSASPDPADVDVPGDDAAEIVDGAQVDEGVPTAEPAARETAEDVLERRLAERPDVLGRGERELPCTLSAPELADVARKLADVIEEAEQEEAEQAEQKASMKETLAGLKARQRKLASTLRRGIEYRMVATRTEADYAAGVAREVRTDTLEVLSSRVLTDRERQPSLLPETVPVAAGAMAVHSEAAEQEEK